MSTVDEALPVTDIQYKEIILHNGQRYVQIWVKGDGITSPKHVDLSHEDVPHYINELGQVNGHGRIVSWFFYYHENDVLNKIVKKVEALSLNSSKPRGHGIPLLVDGQTISAGSTYSI